jgi:hypothetical protein
MSGISDWRFEFQAPVGKRVLRSRFIGIEAGWSDPETPCADVMWWDYGNRRWISDSVFPWGKGNPERAFSSSSNAPCRSFAAFKRHLRKHGQELRSRRVRLVSRFVGHDIVATPTAPQDDAQLSSGKSS